jgi:hypothetical protein
MPRGGLLCNIRCLCCDGCVTATACDGAGGSPPLAVLCAARQQWGHSRKRERENSSNQRTVDTRSILFKIGYHPQDPPIICPPRRICWREEMAHPPSALPLAQTPSGHTKRPIGVDRMIVCYCRPLNLGNLLLLRNFTFKNSSSVSSRLAGPARQRRAVFSPLKHIYF